MPKQFTEAAERLRGLLCKEFGVEISGKKVQVPLLRAIAKQSADVDTDVPEWLDGETPLGIDRPITPRGVFPETQPGTLSTESPLDHWRALAGNHSCFEEHKQAADGLLEDELQRGWTDWAPTRAELKARHGPIVSSKIGVVAKLKAQGLKLLLISVLRRSGAKARVVVKVRIVLPRLKDVVKDVLRLLQKTGDRTLDFPITDFDNAL